MFDPYHTWLCIPSEEQPPTHYRLLGIDPQELDGKVIEAAVIRQTTQIRHYQAGEYGDFANRILNEIAAARICLLDKAKRAVYDASLRKPQEPEFPPSIPLEESPPKPANPVKRILLPPTPSVTTPRKVTRQFPAPPPEQPIPFAPEPIETAQLIRRASERELPDPDPEPVRLVAGRSTGERVRSSKRVKRTSKDQTFYFIVGAVCAVAFLGTATAVMVKRSQSRGTVLMAPPAPRDAKNDSGKNGTGSPGDAAGSTPNLLSTMPKGDPTKAASSIVKIADLAPLGVAQAHWTFGGAPPKARRAGGVVLSREGHFLTCAHLLTSDRRVVVSVDGKQYPADIIAKDLTIDLALLKIRGGKNLVAIPLAKESESKVNEEAMLFSYGAGRRPMYGDQLTATAKIANASGKVEFESTVPWQGIGGIVVNPRGAIVGAIAARVNPAGGSPIAAQIHVSQIEHFLEPYWKPGKVAAPESSEVAVTVARAVGRADQRSNREYVTVAKSCLITSTNIHPTIMKIETEEHCHDLIDELLTMFDEFKSLKAQAAMRYLEFMEPEYRRAEVVAKLEPYLDDRYWSDYAIEAYARFNPERGYELTIPKLSDPNGKDFKRALYAFAHTRDPRVIPVLVKMSKDRTYEGEMIGCFTAFGPGAEDAAIEMFRTNRSMRSSFSQILRSIGGEKTLAMLESIPPPQSGYGNDFSYDLPLIKLLKKRLARLKADEDAFDVFHFESGVD